MHPMLYHYHYMFTVLITTLKALIKFFISLLPPGHREQYAHTPGSFNPSRSNMVQTRAMSRQTQARGLNLRPALRTSTSTNKKTTRLKHGKQGQGQVHFDLESTIFLFDLPDTATWPTKDSLAHCLACTFNQKYQVFSSHEDVLNDGQGRPNQVALHVYSVKGSVGDALREAREVLTEQIEQFGVKWGVKWRMGEPMPAWYVFGDGDVDVDCIMEDVDCIME